MDRSENYQEALAYQIEVMEAYKNGEDIEASHKAETKNGKVIKELEFYPVKYLDNFFFNWDHYYYRIKPKKKPRLFEYMKIYYGVKSVAGTAKGKESTYYKLHELLISEEDADELRRSMEAGDRLVKTGRFFDPNAGTFHSFDKGPSIKTTGVGEE